MDMNHNTMQGISNKLRIIPDTVPCPKCQNIAKWPEYIRNALRFIDPTIESDIEHEEEEHEESEEDTDDDEDELNEQDNQENETNHNHNQVVSIKHNDYELSSEEEDDDDIGMSLRDRLKKRGMKI